MEKEEWDDSQVFDGRPVDVRIREAVLAEREACAKLADECAAEANREVLTWEDRLPGRGGSYLEIKRATIIAAQWQTIAHAIRNRP